MSLMNVPTTSNTLSFPASQKALQPVMKAALGPQHAKVTFDVREDATSEQVLSTLAVCCEGYRKLQDTENAVAYTIGKLLRAVSKRKLFRPKYTYFKDFLQAEVLERYGIGRTHATNALQMAKAFPSLTADQYRKVGPKKLLEAAKVLDEGHEGWRRVLQHAETARSVEDFRTWLRTKEGLTEQRSRRVVRLVVQMRSQRIADQIRTWLDDEDTTKWAETEDDGHKLLKAIGEVGRTARRGPQRALAG